MAGENKGGFNTLLSSMFFVGISTGLVRGGNAGTWNEEASNLPNPEENVDGNSSLELSSELSSSNSLELDEVSSLDEVELELFSSSSESK